MVSGQRATHVREKSLTSEKMTNKSEDQSQDQIPASAYFTASSQRRGCCSSDGGSGGSSCNESQEDRRRNNDTEEEDLDTMGCQAVSESETEEEGLDTIKRNTKTVEPVRPPRVIDGQQQGSSRLEYYNLCHPPPSDPPAIPRRKPVISHLSHSANSEPTSRSNTTSCPTSCLATATTSRSNTDTISSMASLASRTNNIKKKKYQSRRRKGSVCNCKDSGRKTYYSYIVDYSSADTILFVWTVLTRWLKCQQHSSNECEHFYKQTILDLLWPGRMMNRLDFSLSRSASNEYV